MPNNERIDRAKKVMKEALIAAGFTDFPEPDDYNIGEIFAYLKETDNV